MTLQFTSTESVPLDAITALFERTFAASEGEEEGRVIAGLVRALVTEVPEPDLRGYCARANGALLGAIFFSRMTFQSPAAKVFLLSPVAIAPECQGEGIGTRLLRHGLGDMRARQVDVVLTYGDPAFYGRVGFSAVPVTQVPAPCPLSFPNGWLGQDLQGSGIPHFEGPAVCVAPFRQPALW